MPGSDDARRTPASNATSLLALPESWHLVSSQRLVMRSACPDEAQISLTTGMAQGLLQPVAHHHHGTWHHFAFHFPMRQRPNFMTQSNEIHRGSAVQAARVSAGKEDWRWAEEHQTKNKRAPQMKRRTPTYTNGAEDPTETKRRLAASDASTETKAKTTIF